MSAVVFFTTFENKKQASKFASEVLKQNLAACLNILPAIESHYIWKSKKTKATEVLVIGKTTAAKFEKLKWRIKKLHPYEVPELICIPVVDGYKPYLDWVHSPC